MTPQLQQAIRLLQLSSVELQTEVQEALESNMMLEMDEGESEQKSSQETRIIETEAKKDVIKSEELDTYEKFLKWLDSQMKVRTNV